MNRHERRAFASTSRKLAAQRPRTLTRIPVTHWPPDRVALPGVQRLDAWQSRDYLVQLYQETCRSPDGRRAVLWRLTVNRVTVDKTGRFDDAIGWDELQRVKRECGFGDRYAVEVYPRDCDMVNVSNMRHIWLIEQPLPVGWFSYEDPPEQG